MSHQADALIKNVSTQKPASLYIIFFKNNINTFEFKWKIWLCQKLENILICRMHAVKGYASAELNKSYHENNINILLFI